MFRRQLVNSRTIHCGTSAANNNTLGLAPRGPALLIMMVRGVVVRGDAVMDCVGYVTVQWLVVVVLRVVLCGKRVCGRQHGHTVGTFKDGNANFLVLFDL